MATGRSGRPELLPECIRCIGLAILIAALADENWWCRPVTSTHTGAGEPDGGVWRGGLGCHWIVATSSAPRGAVDSDGGGRPLSPCRRSGGVKLEAAVPGGSPGLVGAASTKSGRPRTAGWVGPGERDGKVYARNRCCYASSGNASSNPVDVGWFAVQTRLAGWAGNSRSGMLFGSGRPR
jgi:hypothetical protein